MSALEARVLLSAGLGDHGPMCPCCGLSADGRALVLRPVPVVEPAAPSRANPIGSLAAGVVAALTPGGIPALSSLPGVAASLYLDFDGDFLASWGSYSNITTPAFDQDGNASSFSAGELSAIQQIWAQVAEDYAPFNINVTTVEPSSFANKAALRVAVGGNGAWLGALAGGVSYIDSFTNAITNTAFVFPKNLANGHAKYTAEAASHEAGHAFGLQHQSRYSGATKVAEYYAGPGDGRAPIMGDSYAAARGLWWNGTTTSSSTLQDDMSVIARAANGFGYRPDDRGDTAAAATPLTGSGTQLVGSGIIGTTSDRDAFSFSAGAGQVTVSVAVPQGINNLDARLELRDAAGTTLIASADPGNSFGASITTTLAAGSYRLFVASRGGYGDVGQYTVSASVAASSNPGVAAPTGLTTGLNGSGKVALAWADNASNEAGYKVERSVDGTTWTAIADLSANATSYADGGAAAGSTYVYRVYAYNASAKSGYSNTATATTAPSAPGSLAATAPSSSRVDLSWRDVSGETGYRVYRSTDGGQTWILAGTTGANVTAYQDNGRAAGTTYRYLVRALNAGGESASSAVVVVTTPAGATVPAAPSNLVATSNVRMVSLAWSDNSGNEASFKIQRSSDGGRTWGVIATLKPNTRSFTDTTALRLRTYSYRVRASNAAGDSPASNVVTVTVLLSSVPRGLPAGGLAFGVAVEPSRTIVGLASPDDAPRRPADPVAFDQALGDWTGLPGRATARRPSRP